MANESIERWTPKPAVGRCGFLRRRGGATPRKNSAPLCEDIER